MLATRDKSWAEQSGLPKAVMIALATFGILALELAIIRWSAAQIRVFAYFNNLVLIGAFLGMGLGVALGSRRPGLVHWTLPALAVLSLILALSGQLGIMHLFFPDSAVSLWGADARVAALQLLSSLAILAILFWMVVFVFLCAGTAVGLLFPQVRTLKAYSFDLMGSLLGVLAIALITWANTGPPIWMLLGVAPFLVLSRRPASLVAGIAVIVLSWSSVGQAVYSPYNRIDVVAEHIGERVDYNLSVNRDFHQFMHDFSDASIHDPSLSPEDQANREALRLVYDIPFSINTHRNRALIVGAGTGNDVQAALRNGYQQVYSVDIDGRIIDLGRKLHPEHPYSDPRAIPVVNDARAFFEQYKGPPFDVVCYGLLDSHAMFSAMSTLRLENYVYTVEGIRSAWRLVAPEGQLTLSFSVFAGPWIADRMYWTIAEATGRTPVVINHGMNWGYTYVVAKDPGAVNLAVADVFPKVGPTAGRAQTRVTSDDWPFLYVRPGQFPFGYVLFLSFVLLTGFLAVRGTFGKEMLHGSLDTPMFLMGAAFLLLETRGVTNLSLLFGSTWLVNTSVFAGILVMALVANLLVDRFNPRNPRPWFIPLLGSVVLLIVVHPGMFNALSLPVRGVVGGLFNALPIGFAGVIVSILLARSRTPAKALGSNLLGALVGGCLEYLSMWFGLRALSIIVFGLYALTALLIGRRGTAGVQSGAVRESA